jgi:hypothetical protein
MDKHMQTSFENRESPDADLRYQAFLDIQAQTNEKVDWAYEIWDDLVKNLSHPDNHKRAASSQFLCNLAKSDPDGRIFRDFPALLELTKDEKFVTARHCLQSLWKIGLVGTKQKEILLKGLTERFSNCIAEKNRTLIRFDIIQGLRKLYDEEAEKDEAIRQKALELIATEEDLKYRKKYAAVWKK